MAKLDTPFVRLEHNGGTVEGRLSWADTDSQEKQIHDRPRIFRIYLTAVYTIDNVEHRVTGDHTLTFLQDES